MASRSIRSTALTIFALLNLACWITAAISVGLVVGDEVDLGVETLIRTGQATAVAVWEQASPKVAEAASRSPAATPAPRPTENEGIDVQASTTIDRTTLPADPPPAPDTSAAQEASQPVNPTLPPPTPAPTPQPIATLVKSPLLMADPDMNSLTDLNAEMNRSVSGRAVQIRYQEDRLNHEITTVLEEHPDLPYRDVSVDLKRDRAIIRGKVIILGLEVSTKISGTVVAKDCSPQFKIETISVAAMTTPGFVKDQIEDMLLDAMTWYPADYPLCLEQIVLEETRATVYGYRR